MKRTTVFDDKPCKCGLNGVDKAGVSRFEWFRTDDGLQCPVCPEQRHDSPDWDMYGICGFWPAAPIRDFLLGDFDTSESIKAANKRAADWAEKERGWIYGSTGEDGG
jgi:hypothetical protein